MQMCTVFRCHLRGYFAHPPSSRVIEILRYNSRRPERILSIPERVGARLLSRFLLHAMHTSQIGHVPSLHVSFQRQFAGRNVRCGWNRDLSLWRCDGRDWHFRGTHWSVVCSPIPVHACVPAHDRQQVMRCCRPVFPVKGSTSLPLACDYTFNCMRSCLPLFAANRAVRCPPRTHQPGREAVPERTGVEHFEGAHSPGEPCRSLFAPPTAAACNIGRQLTRRTDKWQE